MQKSKVEFATVTKNEVVQEVGRSTIYQPKTNFSGGSIKWLWSETLHQQETYAKSSITI